MALRAVQKDNDTLHRTSYLKCATIGALTGYSLKYILPVTPHERDDSFKKSLKEINAEAKAAKLEEIGEIRKSRKQSKAANIFVRLYDTKKLKPLKRKKIKKSLTGETLTLLRRVNERAKYVRLLERKDLKVITKSIRPTAGFVLIGASLGFAFAVINNIMNVVAENDTQYIDSYKYLES